MTRRASLILALTCAGVAAATLYSTSAEMIEPPASHSIGVASQKWELHVIFRDVIPEPYDSLTGCEANRIFIQSEMEKEAAKMRGRKIETVPETECKPVGGE